MIELGFELTPAKRPGSNKPLGHSISQFRMEKKNENIFCLPHPGFEPGSPRPQRGVLTTRLMEH